MTRALVLLAVLWIGCDVQQPGDICARTCERKGGRVLSYSLGSFSNSCVCKDGPADGPADGCAR